MEIIQTSLGGGAGLKTSFIRIVRLVRIVRVLKVSKYLTWFRLFGSALAKSAQPLAMLFFIIMICMIFFSSIMFTVERGEWSFEHKMWVTLDNLDVASPYQSIPDAFYWVSAQSFDFFLDPTFVCSCLLSSCLCRVVVCVIICC